MMRALYLHPGMNYGAVDYPIIPMGVIGLVNLVRSQGWETRGVNLALERALDRDLDLDAKIRSCLPADLVLIDLHWYMHSAGAVQVARKVRQYAPDSVIVLGGLSATYFDGELMEFCPEIDLVIRGEAEQPLLELLEQLQRGKRKFSWLPNVTYRDGGKAVRSTRTVLTPCELFDKVDYVSIDWLDHHDEYYRANVSGYAPDQPRRYWLEVGRGCYYNCTICGGSNASHRQLLQIDRPRFRNPASITADLARLQSLGVEQVAFSHDIFTLQVPWLSELIANVRQQQIELGLMHECWGLPSPEAIGLMYQGFKPELSRVAVSAETGDETVRRRNFPSKAFTNRELLSCLESFARYNQDIEVYFAANLPWESTETWKAAIGLMEQIMRVYPPQRLVAYAGYLTIDPLSSMWKNPQDYGITRLFNGFADYYQMTDAGKRRAGYYSDHLSADGLVQNLKAFRDGMMHLMKG